MYPVDVATRGTFTEHDGAELEVLGLTTEQRVTRHRNHTTMVTETGLDPWTVGKLLYDAKVSADIATARGEAEPDVQVMNEATRAVIIDTYGHEDAEQLLARVQGFARQHPQLAAILQTRGIGSRVDVVTALVAHVRATNWQPRTR
jgi:hypothetical protein